MHIICISEVLPKKNQNEVAGFELCIELYSRQKYREMPLLCQTQTRSHSLHEYSTLFAMVNIPKYVILKSVLATELQLTAYTS